MRARALPATLAAGLFGALALFSPVATAQAPREIPAKQQYAHEGEPQAICALCGDYTFDKKMATQATYEGKEISLCSLSELELLKKNPDKYVWATDPVSGSKVHKIKTSFTVDRKVKVKKKDGVVEMWPRRFFFESAKTRDEFLKNPESHLKEPYPV